MKTIGIIGGSTEVATAEYYKLINLGINKRLGGFNTGEIIINSMNFDKSAHYVQGELWEEGGKYLQGKALSLERAGADFFLCVSNTWHIAAPVFTKDVHIPFLHILDSTVAAVKGQDLRTVLLLGTKATMESEALLAQYSQRGIEIVVPNGNDQAQIDDIIFMELSKGSFTAQARQKYLDIVDKHVAKGVEGIILGCTEIPLLINQRDRPSIPMFDTLKLHVEAAVNMALE
ncbi:uncharacterized protein PFLUO_LOCUS4603 [Penicillium psychrofluorescens]|uniref:uncharacterized protein n=1 Tax=Penicillium psychrofluorescens TaxID=3158075 RepID=UPI003CCE4A1B